MKTFLTYFATPNEGPEPQRLGSPYDLLITPGVPFECDPGLATILLQIKPQFKRTNADGLPVPETSVAPPEIATPEPTPDPTETKKGKKR